MRSWRVGGELKQVKWLLWNLGRTPKPEQKQITSWPVTLVSQKLNVALIVSCTFFQQAICCAPFSLGSACGSIVHCSCHPSPDAAVSCCSLLFNWICSLLQECYRAVNGKLFPDEGLLTWLDTSHEPKSPRGSSWSSSCVVSWPDVLTPPSGGFVCWFAFNGSVRYSLQGSLHGFLVREQSRL